jgi:hypothetical protein
MNRRPIDEVERALNPVTLLCILGPAGAGKSGLCDRLQSQSVFDGLQKSGVQQAFREAVAGSDFGAGGMIVTLAAEHWSQAAHHLLEIEADLVIDLPRNVAFVTLPGLAVHRCTRSDMILAAGKADPEFSVPQLARRREQACALRTVVGVDDVEWALDCLGELPASARALDALMVSVLTRFSSNHQLARGLHMRMVAFTSRWGATPLEAYPMMPRRAVAATIAAAKLTVSAGGPSFEQDEWFHALHGCLIEESHPVDHRLV